MTAAKSDDPYFPTNWRIPPHWRTLPPLKHTSGSRIVINKFAKHSVYSVQDDMDGQQRFSLISKPTHPRIKVVPFELVCVPHVEVCPVISKGGGRLWPWISQFIAF